MSRAYSAHHYSQPDSALLTAMTSSFTVTAFVAVGIERLTRISVSLYSVGYASRSPIFCSISTTFFGSVDGGLPRA